LPSPCTYRATNAIRCRQCRSLQFTLYARATTPRNSASSPHWTQGPVAAAPWVSRGMAWTEAFKVASARSHSWRSHQFTSMNPPRSSSSDANFGHEDAVEVCSQVKALARSKRNRFPRRAAPRATVPARLFLLSCAVVRSGSRPTRATLHRLWSSTGRMRLRQRHALCSRPRSPVPHWRMGRMAPFRAVQNRRTPDRLER